MQGIVEVLPINYCGLSVEVLPLGIELGVTAPQGISSPKLVLVVG